MYGANDASSMLIEVVISVISEICLTRRRLLLFFACSLGKGLMGQVVDLAGITTAVLGLLAKALLKNSNEVVDSRRVHVVVFASSTFSREGIRSNSIGPGSTGMESKFDEVTLLVRNIPVSLLPLSLRS